MRKTMKSALYDCFQSVNAEVDCTNAAYVIDGGYLLHHVVWDQEETFIVIFEKYVQYLRRHYGHTVTVPVNQHFLQTLIINLVLFLC